MRDSFIPPAIPTTDGKDIPSCPRRLLNSQLFLKDDADLPQIPLMGARKMRLRYAAEQSILVNDAGLVRPPAITGQPA